MAPVDRRDWSSLPPELLEQIATTINIQSDYIRFRAVCNPWRSSTPARPTHLPCQLPWLLFPPGDDKGINDEGSSTNPQGGDESSSAAANSRRRCIILQVDSNKHRYLRLSEPLHRRHLGSSHGWIFSLDTSLSGAIFNPLTGAKLSLPPLNEDQFQRLDDDFLAWRQDDHEREHPRNPVRKFLLSDSPRRNPEFSALASLAGVLACYKSGQDSWKLIPEINTYVEDAAYFQGMAYVVHESGDITVCDVSGDSPVVVEKMELTGIATGIHSYYLVPSGNDLLLVASWHIVQRSVKRTYSTWRFVVYRLNSQGRKWERVRNLGDLALFIGGDSCSSAPMASHFPGCKPNSIYVAEDVFDDRLNHRRARRNIGIFTLKDGYFQRFSGRSLPSPAHPIWFTPNPF